VRRGWDPQPFQHPPHRRGADPVAQAEQLTLDPLVSPARVLPRHLLDQHCEPGIDRRPAAAMRIGPPPADQTPVPAEQRVRRHQTAHPQRPGQQPGQGGDHHPVRPVQPRLRILPPQHRDLLAQHQQFRVLRRRRTRQHHHPPCQPDEYQIQHPHRHKPAILPAQRPERQAYSQVNNLYPRFGTPQVTDPANLAAQHRVVVPEHQEFGILGHLTPGQHHHTAEQTAHEQVDAREDHSGMISARKTPPATPDRVIEPHR
jgi:hypothetical protein